MRRGERQLFLVRLPGEARVESRDHYDTTRTKSRHKITIHRVLIDVDLDLAHVADQRRCCCSRASVSRTSASRSASTSP